MTYLITTKNNPPYTTSSFDIIYDYNGAIGMVVYDLENGIYTDNGVTWKDIENKKI